MKHNDDFCENVCMCLSVYYVFSHFQNQNEFIEI